jgi:hypothetical protein
MSLISWAKMGTTHIQNYCEFMDDPTKEFYSITNIVKSVLNVQGIAETKEKKK